jgi:hypothetical protein
MKKSPSPFAADEPWVAVKCLFSHPNRVKDSEQNLYEERVTLWQAGSFDEAFRLAEAEAKKYAASDDCIFVRTTDAFHLFDQEVGHSSEIWSTMRGSGMDAETYASTFCCTSRDRVTFTRDND